MRLILASASQGRLGVLRSAGIDPVVRGSGGDEDALAATLAEASSNSDGSPDLIYGQEGARKKAPGRLSLSPIRAGQ